MRQTDLRESPLEKLESPERPRSAVYNWGLIVSIFFAIGLFFLGMYLYSVIFPDAPITTMVAIKIIFLVFLLFFVVYSIFALYHAFRFGFEGDLTIVSTSIYIIVSVVIVIIAWNLIF